MATMRQRSSSSTQTRLVVPRSRPCPDTNYLLGFANGVERARILFPRRCMNQLLEPYGYVANLWVRQGTVTVDVWDRLAPIYSSLHYQFDRPALAIGVALGRVLGTASPARSRPPTRSPVLASGRRHPAPPHLPTFLHKPVRKPGTAMQIA